MLSASLVFWFSSELTDRSSAFTFCILSVSLLFTATTAVSASLLELSDLPSVLPHAVRLNVNVLTNNAVFITFIIFFKLLFLILLHSYVFNVYMIYLSFNNIYTSILFLNLLFNFVSNFISIFYSVLIMYFQ